MKLFAVYLGGNHPKGNIELHDVVFVCGNSIEETYPKLKEKWFAYPEEYPHIDSYIELTHADGFEILLSREKPLKTEQKLFFVNFGGYTEHLFGEVHESAFYVVDSKASARKKADKELCVGLLSKHLDDNLNVSELVSPGLAVDDILEIEQVDGYYLSFIPSDIKETPQAKEGYIRIVPKEKALTE